VRDLFLGSTGKSICSEIYTKEGDILDRAGDGQIYQSLIDEMNGLKSNGTVADWRSIAYDWRLSLNDLLTQGKKSDGKIYYALSTTTPYIEQTLRELRKSSKSGRVTIIAHSNGGLVAKALLNKLGNEAPALVDRLILVGSPQSGTPLGIGALLFGTNQRIMAYGNIILHAEVARAFAQNAPMAYHLLPSEDYLESTASDLTHPVIRFSGDAYAREIAAYGRTITNRASLADFLIAKEGGRVKPKENDLQSAEIANPVLVDYARDQHALLDSWEPPAGVAVDEITGWGVDTMAGIDFYTPWLSSKRSFKPIFTEDGDGTVTVPSALMLATSTQVRRYWIDLRSLNKLSSIKYEHKNLFESSPLKLLLSNIITSSTNTLPSFISDLQPSSTSDKKLVFILHSPLTLELSDSSGHTTGLKLGEKITQDIPGSTYGELGEVKYVVVPEGDTYQLTMHGQSTGTFSLDIQETMGTTTTTSTLADLPTTASTTATLSVSGGVETVSPLIVDIDGDGKSDISIVPKPSETVYYDPPEVQAPAPLPFPVPKRPSQQPSLKESVIEVYNDSYEYEI
jgi:pimeloyl-ACP methyl ester carboxylesterase